MTSASIVAGGFSETIAPADAPRQPVLAGGFAAVVLAISLVVWACLMSVAGGAIATGFVSVEGSRKAVQHRDGGPVRAVLVREGEVVTKGQTVVQLDTTESEADVAVLSATHVQTLARLARLRAEAGDATTIDWSSALSVVMDYPSSRIAMEQENAIFSTRLASYKGHIELLKGQIEGRLRAIEGFRARLVAASVQLQSVQDELASLAPLVAKGFVAKPRTIALERTAAGLSGDIASAQASISGEQNNITQAEIQIAQLEKDRREVIAKETGDAESKLAEVGPRLASAKEKLSRAALVAPERGRVHALSVVNAGAVLAPGQTVMEIVPTSEPLVLTVEINPQDVERVHPGQEVVVHLLAYKQRFQSIIKGELESVSADRFEDKFTKDKTFFKGVVKVPPNELSRAGVELLPGMPVQVVIQTEARTVLAYFLDPVLRLYDYAFRER